MNLIEQREVVWGETPYTKEESVLWIEKAGRVCYRSEDKIVEGSGTKFVNNIIKRKHSSVLEHSNLVLRSTNRFKMPLSALKTIQSVFNSKYLLFAIKKDRIYIAGNWRAWIEYYNNNAHDFADMINLENIHTIFECNDYEVVTDPEDVPNSLKCITAEFVTDRAVTHELVRHRPASYSQESQRYVRYGDINFIVPAWFKKYDESSFVVEKFKASCEEAETYYNKLIDLGLKAEDARVVLPNATATKIVMTATIPEWKHVFNLRVSKVAYPQIRMMLAPVKKQFIEKGWIDE